MGVGVGAEGRISCAAQHDIVMAASMHTAVNFVAAMVLVISVRVGKYAVANNSKRRYKKIPLSVRGILCIDSYLLILHRAPQKIGKRDIKNVR